MNFLLAVISPFNELVLVSLVGIAGGLYLFVRGFRLLARKRLLVNTPTSKIRSASMGLVEVSGTATGPYTLNTPIAGIPCFLYRTVAWQKSDEGRNSKDWRKVAEETLHVPFFLDDGTGQLLVQPRGAELDLHSDFHQTYSDTILSPHATQATISFLARHGVNPDNKIRVEEWSIRPQSQIFVVGTLGENPGIEVAPGSKELGDMRRGLKVTIGQDVHGSQPQEVIHLSEPPGNSVPATQQAKIAAALTKAGITNPAAWEVAGISQGQIDTISSPKVSAIAVNRESQAQNAQDHANFNLAPPVALIKGENNPAFMISWRSQKELVRSLAWKSFATIWGGGALALLGLYVLLAQFEVL